MSDLLALPLTRYIARFSNPTHCKYLTAIIYNSNKLNGAAGLIAKKSRPQYHHSRAISGAFTRGVLHKLTAETVSAGVHSGSCSGSKPAGSSR